MKTLLTWQQFTQNIPKSSREADCKKSSTWLLFWQEIYVWKHTCFLFHKVAKFMKRSKTVELNLNIEFRRVVLFNFQLREKFWNHLLDSTLRQASSSRRLYLSCPNWKIYMLRRDKNHPVSLFIPSRLSYKQPLNGERWENIKTNLYLTTRLKVGNSNIHKIFETNSSSHVK